MRDMGGMTGGIRDAQIARNPFKQRILRKATGGMRDFCAVVVVILVMAILVKIENGLSKSATII